MFEHSTNHKFDPDMIRIIDYARKYLYCTQNNGQPCDQCWKNYLESSKYIITFDWINQTWQKLSKAAENTKSLIPSIKNLLKAGLILPKNKHKK